MADIVCVPEGTHARRGYWALSFSGTVQPAEAGNNSNIYLPSTLLPTIAEYGASIIVDGLSWRYASPGNTPIIQPFVQPSDNMNPIYVGRYTAADIVMGYASGLGIPLNPDAATGFKALGLFVITTVAVDAYRFLAWGRYLIPPLEPPPQPVSLEGIKWPLTRRY